MSQRERFLSILIGGLLVVTGIWWGLGKYRSAIGRRNNQLINLQQTQDQLNEQRMQGEYANRQMGEYLIRSLPSNQQQARSQYKAWLLSILQKNELSDRSVDPTSSREIDDVYREFAFRVQGKTSPDKLVSLLYDFYTKDYLHRIRGLTIRPNRDKALLVEMTIDVLSLNLAAADSPVPEGVSYRVGSEFADYRDSILNRNIFSPPNQAPVYEGNVRLEAIVDKATTFSLVFKDHESHALSYELIQPKLVESKGVELKENAEEPATVSIDSNSGSLQVQSGKKEPIDVVVRVSDDGYPRRSTDQALTIHIVDLPTPPKPEEPKLAFDDAKQTVLTALVQGREEWTAWMHVRTRGETLKLRVGDSFEIGTVKGKVVEVTDKYAKLEIDGSQYELRPSGKLAELITR